MEAIMQEAKYEDIRHRISAGDDIFFSGTGPTSDIIRMATFSPVTHVGSVFQTWDTLDGSKRVRVIESVSGGVRTTFLSERLSEYVGNIWWAPLSPLVREYFDEDAFFNFMYAQEGKPYDIPQAILSAFPTCTVAPNQHDLDKLFCSELRTEALKIATRNMINSLIEVVSKDCTPGDCCHQHIHEKVYYQISGVRQRIPNFS